MDLHGCVTSCSCPYWRHSSWSVWVLQTPVWMTSVVTRKPQLNYGELWNLTSLWQNLSWCHNKDSILQGVIVFHKAIAARDWVCSGSEGELGFNQHAWSMAALSWECQCRSWSAGEKTGGKMRVYFACKCECACKHMCGVIFLYFLLIIFFYYSILYSCQYYF